MSDTLWNYDEPIKDLPGVDVPDWIEQDITGSTVQAIVQGGCSSGAYMPAVTYYDARKTMSEHGDEVLQYVENHWGELPSPQTGESWSGIAVFYLSMAVECWANAIASELEDAIKELEEEEEEEE
tara:strand:+ start:204 stop:578 length:375 start_codon:yes stop_codon:yes gene_type:complete